MFILFILLFLIQWTSYLSSASNILTDHIIRTQIINPPEDVKVILSTTAEIKCGVKHDPSVPYNLSWYSNDNLINTSSSNRLQVLSDGTLRIEQARNTDVGIYECRVVSSAGNDARSARLDLIELPHAPSDVKADLNIKGGFVNVSWTPNFDGNSPIVRYIVYSRVISSDSENGQDPGDFTDMMRWNIEVANISSKQNFVLVTNLRPAKTYQFRISAVNSVGEGQSSSSSYPPVTLPAQPPSAPPLGVVGAARSSTSIMIQWQQPSNDAHNGKLLGYMIRYKLARYTDTPWYYRNVTNPDQLSYHLDDLIVWQNYEIQVGAFNEMGVGTYSQSICIRTKEGKPADSPKKVHAFALSSTVIQVSWKPPDPQLINGINQGYKVRARLDNSTIAKEIIVDPHHFTDREHITELSELDPFTQYSIDVSCFTNAGEGPPSSPPILVITKEDLPGEVENFRFWDIFDKTVSVGWSKPKKINGELIGFTLKYYIDDAPKNQWRVVNFTANTFEAVIKGLKPLTSYKFEINAWTKIGSGPVKVALLKTSIPPVLPLPPTRLAISNIGAFSVVLQFTPGFNGNASIIKWLVEAQIFKLRNASWFLVYESTNKSSTNAIVVKNLHPFTEYRLRLIPVNIVGGSLEPSEPSPSFQTLQAPPAHPPSNVTLRSLNSTTLRVKWTPLPLEAWFGTPRGYNITWHEIRESANGSLHWHVSSDYHSHSYLITGLEEFTNYAVQIFALNDVGTSSGSRSMTHFTSEATPSAPPNNVRVTATSSTTILVQWSNVPSIHANGIILGFKIKHITNRHGAMGEYKKIEGNETRTATLTELKKYTLYRVSVCAYTHLGDGVYSPSYTVQTLQDVPGMPSNVTFPDVTSTSARILWDIPEEPNGEILAYRITYRMNIHDNSLPGNYQEFNSTDRTHKFYDLTPNTYYLFSVAAKTKEGWGQPANALVYTTNNREPPGAPIIPTNIPPTINSRQVTFSWIPGSDGLAPIRYYTVQVASQGGPWSTIPRRIDPSLTTYSVSDLKPFTRYQFRIRSTNDIGHSPWSNETSSIRTLPAPPDHAVSRITISSYSPTAISVKWLPIKDWNGDEFGAGYKIKYCLNNSPLSHSRCPSTIVQGPAVTGVLIDNLERDRHYEITVIPFNGQGEGPPSKAKQVYVGEAVPSGAPLNVQAMALSSTEVNVTWLPPANDKQNGQILGYKIYYAPEGNFSDGHDPWLSKIEESRISMESVPPNKLSYVAFDLEMFTTYAFSVSVFNPAGDGPRSSPVKVKTKEDIPGIVGDLKFSEITMSSLKVSWDPPAKSNGLLIGYYVVYETSLNESDFSKQVKQSVAENHLTVKGLKENVTYTFRVRAKTSVGMGSERIGKVTTGPQTGSPPPVNGFTVLKTLSNVKLRWNNPRQESSCEGPILGYLVEVKLISSDIHEWQPIIELRNGLQESYDLSFTHFKPSSKYKFRMMTINKCGISVPSIPEEGPLKTNLIITPANLEMKSPIPFYFESWFVSSVAFSMVLVVILFISGLCVYSTTYKYKQEVMKSESHDGLSENELGLDDSLHNLYSGFDQRLGTNSSISRSRSNGILNRGIMAATKSPPRPSPGSIMYSDEEDDEDEEIKDGQLYGSSGDSVTEKPSECSSSGPESESDHEGANHFVNHYANVNDTLKKGNGSWKRGAASYVVGEESVNMPCRPPPPIPVPGPPSYQAEVTGKSDDLDCPSVNLNGGRIIVNNMAGSRAPLPGFSSFV